MDCREMVEDYCNAFQSENLKIPNKIPSSVNNLDQFFIVFEVEITSPCSETEEDAESENKEDDESDYQEDDEKGKYQFVEVEDTSSFTFWEPCPRIEHGNLPRSRVTSMLDSLGVPRHKQGFMVDKISDLADEIANAAHNAGRRVLPIMVTISIVACLCYGESVVDD